MYFSPAQEDSPHLSDIDHAEYSSMTYKTHPSKGQEYPFVDGTIFPHSLSLERTDDQNKSLLLSALGQDRYTDLVSNVSNHPAWDSVFGQSTYTSDNSSAPFLSKNHYNVSAATMTTTAPPRGASSTHPMIPCTTSANKITNSRLVTESYEDDYATQANLQLIMEKRRRRRESHNAVERRRRDNINERIQELGTLLLDNINNSVIKLNKGAILRKSVEQMRSLQEKLAEYQQRVHELETYLHQIKRHRN
ncbi:uncharacterized protein BYT42DRAFT_572749 [Radiomyces spectabilis]|uniref:uncharacterized protein n=1 Tax=Radiomyces spectabilis TaxID=64574 RepID=UPI002220F1D5|nr:uncharacterized protein BYT42DRAFT_572749 [Radiomyces spectabilis]KAI8375912.1 hypothetical protein BYT42DRAFT_572749 [Radiomyces spectabilis]